MTREEKLCRQVEENMDAFLDGEVSLLEANAIEGHLDSCASCREVSRSSREISDLLRLEGRRVPEVPRWSSIQTRLEKTESRGPFRRGRLALLAASISIVVGAASLVLMPHDAPLDLSVSNDRWVNESPIQMAGFGLPGLERFLSEHRAVEIDPPEIMSQGLTFEPRIPDRLPGGFRIEKAYVIQDSCCAGVCFLFKDRNNRRVGLVQMGPSHPFVWKGARLAEREIGRTRCLRVRLDQVELTQIDPDGRNLTLVVGAEFSESDDLVRYLTDL